MSDDRNNPVGRFEIYVQDMQRAKVFYEAVFGTQFTKLEDPALEPGMVVWPFPVHQTGYGATGAGEDAGVRLGRQPCARVLRLRGPRRRGRESGESRRAHPETEDVHRAISPHRACLRHRRQPNRPALDAVAERQRRSSC